MSLRLRLVFAFLLVALLGPATAGFLLLRESRAEFRADYDARMARVRDGASRRVAAVVDDLAAALERLQADPALHEIDQDLARGVLTTDPAREREALRSARRLLRAPGLDLLAILDAGAGGAVVALGHRRGTAPADPRGVSAARGGAGPLFRMADFEAGGALVARPTVQVARRAGDRVSLLVGRVLDDALLEDLVAASGVEARVALLDTEGAVLAGHDVPAGDPAWEISSLPLGDGATFSLRVGVSRASLLARERSLLGVTGAVGALAAAIALLLGALLASRITRPLAALSEAARRIADGELEVPLPRAGRRDEIGRLVGAFDTMTRARQATLERAIRAERIAAWKDIARRIAHEIKNPLFPIQTSIETLQKARIRNHPDFDEIFEESTATILEEVERMKRIVTEFARFARLPAPSPHEVDAAALVAQVGRLHAGVDERVAVEVVRTDAPLPLRADGELLSQVLVNFVQNAVDAVAARGGGRVVVAAALDGPDVVVLSVDDDGPGIPEADRLRVFEPYFTRKEHGTGLGLAIASRIVTDHGGAVRVEPSPLGGARFIARLPRGGPPDRPMEDA